MPETTQQAIKKIIVTQKRGWSGKNIFLGLGLLFVGFVIWFADSVIIGIASGVSGKKLSLGFWGGLGFALMAFGVLGYWITIPAIQRWWNVKRWLALTVGIERVVHSSCG